ncbi:hypothetical protein [Tahibacter caeni]|uniref:hypothetical protein n=1 Tax=Tahibacter caeni TaxID=1453545 RepID=UPI002149761E|nr:hypothetical protein [Tahibacter caeni]
MDIAFPEDFFTPPTVRPDEWPDDPDLRRAVEWFRSLMPRQQWVKRRENAARRLYQTTLGRNITDPKGTRVFDPNDTFGWHLFLAESHLDHIWNFEPIYGSRVVPVFRSIGRNIERLLDIEGSKKRVRKMIASNASQPNGTMFELLVAAAYSRIGAQVKFVDESKTSKSHDLDILLKGVSWAVECKRMEVGDYTEQERLKIGSLWSNCTAFLEGVGANALCNVQFFVELSAVPSPYLKEKVDAWIESGRTSLEWADDISHGTISILDISPLQYVLRTDLVLQGSTRILQLLTGEYVRNGNYRTSLRTKLWSKNPRYIEECSQAIVLHWQSLSDTAISGKARDIRKKIVEANEQLPPDRPGVIHVGFEAVDGNLIEQERHKKILANAREFVQTNKQLEYVYAHCFAPECPPTSGIAFDETTIWCAIRNVHPRPMDDVFLVAPDDVAQRPGGHWQAPVE